MRRAGGCPGAAPRESELTPQRRRRLLSRRQGHRCALCQRFLNGDWTLDHVVPVSKGGTSRAENLMLAHGRCNGSRGSATIASDVRTRRIIQLGDDQ